MQASQQKQKQHIVIVILSPLNCAENYNFSLHSPFGWGSPTKGCLQFSTVFIHSLAFGLRRNSDVCKLGQSNVETNSFENINQALLTFLISNVEILTITIYFSFDLIKFFDQIFFSFPRYKR